MAKEIQHSVGFGGSNFSGSVMVVQYLLNCVPAGRGGPTPELAVDGIIGPKTLAAIRKFQTTNFGTADGRVDPNGRTLHALQSFDPRPNQAVEPSGAVFKMSMPPAPGTTSGAVLKSPASGVRPGGFKSPGSPGFGSAPGGSPFKQPGAPSPFGKKPGSGGPGQFGGGKWGG